MLRKLLKYEYRASIWLMPFLYLAAAILYGAGWAARAIGITQLVGTFCVGLVLAGMAGLVVSFVMVITRYYKGMFGAEGYLSQTLPVSKGLLLASRMIVALTMVVCGLVLMFACVLGLLHLVGATDDLAMLFRQFRGFAAPILWGAAVMFLVQLVLFVVEVYFAVTLANTRSFLSNNLLFSVLFYFAVNMAVSVLELIGLLVLPLGVRIGEDGVSFVAQGMLPTLLDLGMGQHGVDELFGATIGLGSVLVDLAALAALLLLTRWLLNRKTSVK